MKPNNIIIACVSILFTAQYTFSQKCPDGKSFNKPGRTISELSFGIGGAHYFGDLNTFNKSDSKIEELHKENMGPAVSLNYRLYLSRFFNPRISFFYTRLGGSDRYNQSDENYSASWFRQFRNLTFRTDILELSLLAEFNLLGFLPGDQRRIISPFVIAGVGLIYFNPKAPYNQEWISQQSDAVVSPITNSSDYQYDEWVKLQPLGTEGQGLPGNPGKYSLIQPNYTIGLGLKCNLSSSVSLSWEVSHHFTFTDYLDDVSTVYPDPKEYYSHYDEDKARMAANLSVRSKEVDPYGYNSYITAQGQQRGNPKYRDSYLVSQVVIGYKLSNRHSSKANPKKIQKQEDKKNEKNKKEEEKQKIDYYKDKYYNKRSSGKQNLSKI